MTRYMSTSRPAPGSMSFDDLLEATTDEAVAIFRATVAGLREAAEAVAIGAQAEAAAAKAEALAASTRADEAMISMHTRGGIGLGLGGGRAHAA